MCYVQIKPNTKICIYPLTKNKLEFEIMFTILNNNVWQIKKYILVILVIFYPNYYINEFVSVCLPLCLSICGSIVCRFILFSSHGNGTLLPSCGGIGARTVQRGTP